MLKTVAHGIVLTVLAGFALGGAEALTPEYVILGLPEIVEPLTQTLARFSTGLA
jgi:hypothetical protein